MATSGVRTWKRISNDSSVGVDERIKETTQIDRLEQCIAEADFITIPRTVRDPKSGSVLKQGYEEDYAKRLHEQLQTRFGFIGRLTLLR